MAMCPKWSEDVHATVRNQIKTPFKNMPSFAELTQDDVDALIAFLKSL
jgi:hypothetical protein